jgi:hypothetical protein
MTADPGPPAGGTEEDLPPFVHRPLSSSFERREVVIAPGGTRAYDEAEWRGAIVVVERGQVELAQHGNNRRRFGRGDILYLEGLALRTLHNPGREPTVLIAVARRTAVTAERADREG